MAALQEILHVKIPRLFEGVRSYFPSRTVGLVDASIPCRQIDLKIAEELDCYEARQGEAVSYVFSGSTILDYAFEIERDHVKDAKSLIEIEVARIMPMPLNEVYWGFALNFEEDGSVTARIAAVKKTFVAIVLKRANLLSLPVVGASLQTTGERIPIKLPDLRFQSVSKAGLFCALVVGAFILFDAALVPFAARIAEETERVRASIAEARTATLPVSELQREVRALEGLSKAVIARINEHRHIALLEDLTTRSPRDVVLEDLRVADGRVFITGKGLSPAEWALALQESPYLENVRLSSILSGAEEGLRRFEVQASVNWLPSAESVDG